MKLPRKNVCLAAGAAILPGHQRASLGHSPTDAAGAHHRRLSCGRNGRHVARLMAQWLSERLGQPFLTENRTGAGGNNRHQSVVRAPADGYAPPGRSAERYQRNAAKTQFQFIRDIAPVAASSAYPMRWL